MARTILVVDDEIAIGKMLGKFLSATKPRAASKMQPGFFYGKISAKEGWLSGLRRRTRPEMNSGRHGFIPWRKPK